MDRGERDTLVLSGVAKQAAAHKYLFTGPRHTLHSFADLGSVNLGLDSRNLRRFLPGTFVFEHDGRRKRELLETPEALALRICEVSQ